MRKQAHDILDKLPGQFQAHAQLMDELFQLLQKMKLEGNQQVEKYAAIFKKAV